MPGVSTGWSCASAGDAAEPPPAGITIRPIADADWPVLIGHDAAAFGADRSAVLARLRGRLPAAELIAERDGRFAGFLLGRDGRVAAHVGPLIADDDEVARALLARALDALDGPLFIDLADAKTAVRGWLEARGFAAGGRSPACFTAERSATTTRRAPSRSPARSSGEALVRQRSAEPPTLVGQWEAARRFAAA